MRAAIAASMEEACHWIDHLGGCGLLNRTWYLWYDERTDEFRIELPNLWHRLYVWAAR